MDDDVVDRSTISVDDVDTVDPEVGSKNSKLLEGISSNEEVLQELGGAGEALTRVELDIACSSEKLVNLNILMMHVAEKESDFETFASEPDHTLADSSERALEFDLLSGILDSEVRELDNCVADIQSEVVNAQEIISSCGNLREAFAEMVEKLHDSEESLKQSQNQVSEMRVQSAGFQKTLSCYREEANGNGDRDVDVSPNGQSSNVYAKIKMQTADQQRCVLRMLEKSLARELDLEKKLTESRLIEDELRLRLHSSEQEISCVEGEVEIAWENFFEADSAAVVFSGVSKELIDRLQIYQLNLKGSTQQEAQLNLELQSCMEQLKAKEIALQKLESSSVELHGLILKQINSLKATLREAEDKLVLSDSEASTLKGTVGSLEKQLKESEFQLLSAKSSLDGTREQHLILLADLSELKKVIDDAKGKFFEAESRAKSAESNSKLLTKSNVVLNEGLLKESGRTSEKVALLERQLRESDIKLQHAVASAEASQEKQSMLYSTVGDMDSLIEDMKLKVLKAERQAESAEKKCMILSESNADLNGELSFMRSRLKSLETSLHQAEGTRMQIAKGINLRTKIITDLVMQLAIERERLYNRISSLTEENNVLAKKSQQANEDPYMVTRLQHEVHGREYLYPWQDFTSTTIIKDSKQVKELSTAKVEDDKGSKNVSPGEAEAGPVDSISNLGTVRTIDASLFNFKHFFTALLILLISMAVYWFLREDCPF